MREREESNITPKLGLSNKNEIVSNLLEKMGNGAVCYREIKGLILHMLSLTSFRLSRRDIERHVALSMWNSRKG